MFSDIIVESPLYQEIQLDGRKTGEEILLSKILTRKFGVLDELTTASLRKLSLDETESLAESIFDLETKADLTKWLDSKEPSVN
jgi:Domain of unknown function (DUF4351)